MKRRTLALSILLLIATHSIQAQSTKKLVQCGVATAALITYATQVDRTYRNEYAVAIPNMRCPAYDPWGRAFNPILVQNCRVQMVGMLNNWYGQQSVYVNNWYAQIVNACATKPPAEDEASETATNKIDTKKIEDLTGGIDEDKAIRITIPKTAEGFKPRP